MNEDDGDDDEDDHKYGVDTRFLLCDSRWQMR